ncbi:MAG TPA: hypothetical protein VK119_09700 [Bacillota bacterium]|nr:hypothetical protein [Bacillota bacterium]
MQMEHKIIGMLEKIMTKQDKNSKKLDEHSKKLDEHTRILSEHSQKLDEHRTTLDEHGQILGALRVGQEHIKAEMDRIKVANAKEFSRVKKGMDDFSTNIELLREESWEHKNEIRRIKKTMGIR